MSGLLNRTFRINNNKNPQSNFTFRLIINAFSEKNSPIDMTNRDIYCGSRYLGTMTFSAAGSTEISMRAVVSNQSPSKWAAPGAGRSMTILRPL